MDRKTARDLLAHALGEKHAEHTIVSRSKRSKISATVKFKCSCRAVEEIAASPTNLDALRNVPEDLK